MNKRKVRNITVWDLADQKTYNRISNLTANDTGVCFRFEIPYVDNEFVAYAHECMQILKQVGIEDYTFSLVTLNPDSSQPFLKSATRVLSTDELERLIDLEYMLPPSAKLVVSEKYHAKFHDFSLSDSIQANELINTQVQYIKSLELSPFEEYLMAYDVASQFWYNDKNDTHQKNWYQSRLLTSSLTDEFFVCAAHAKVLCGLLAGLGIDSEIQWLYINIGTKGHRNDELHNNVMVYLNDPKYGIDGIVFCDPCNDSDELHKTTTKKGDVLYHSQARNTMLLSAVNVEDVKDMKKSFTFDEENFLQFLYQNNAALVGDNYKQLFDAFDDEFMAGYLEFFLKAYPQYKDELSYEKFLTGKEFAYLTNECADYATSKFMKVFGDIKVASAVEKADLSLDDCNLVYYSNELIKLYMQTVILKFNHIPENKIEKYIVSRRPAIIAEISGFDKDYQIAKRLEHNNYIANKYGNDVSEVEPLGIEELFTYYKTVADDSYIPRMLYCFSKRKNIANMIQDVRINSPVIKLEDYYQAYARILQAQGYPENKIIGYINEKVESSVRRASDWFDAKSSNAFRIAAEEMWKLQNAQNGQN